MASQRGRWMPDFRGVLALHVPSPPPVVRHAQPPAQASNRGRTVLIDENGQPIGGDMQTWVDGSALPTVPGQVTVKPSPWPNVGTSTAPGQPIFTGTQPATRQSLLHELTHQFDYALDADPQRAQVVRATAMQILGRAGDWHQQGGNSPHEQFAEAGALASEFPQFPAGGLLQAAGRIGYGVTLGPKRLRAVQALVREAMGGADAETIRVRALRELARKLPPPR